MIKKSALFACLFCSFISPLNASASLTDSALWQPLPSSATDRLQARPADAGFRQMQAEDAQLRSLLWQAPRDDAGMPGTILDLPLPDGRFIAVEVLESPVLSAQLSQAFPDIKTFRARGIDNPDISGRLDYTPNGFHALLNTPEGTIYINPETNYNPDAGRHIYRTLNRGKETATREFQCKTAGHQHRDGNYAYLAEAVGIDVIGSYSSERTFGSTLRTYRLALSATREYSLAVAGGNANNTYAEMVTAVNRINEVYERDAAVFLQLVSNTNLIATSTSSFADDDPEAMLGQNQTWIDNRLGAGNYDIGHIFSTGGGGLAMVAVACDTDGYKAQGVTGSASPTTDAFYIDYVAHEIGHQLGATHSFNADGNKAGACNGNRQPHTWNGSSFLAASAYEVGSGSTIMAYAGICDTQDLQTHSDDYFHARSIEQIRQFVDGDLASLYPEADGSRCGTTPATGDTAPVANAGSNYTIPGNTPFVLSGSATDTDPGSTFIYTWEQYDLGEATTSQIAMHTDQGEGPLVRSYKGSSSPQRYIPTLATILSGNLAANTGERLPTTDRTMNFRLTVRSGTHGIAQDDMLVTVDKDAGPFQVSAPANGSSHKGFDQVNVTWNVAKTSAAPVNCAWVDIHYSTNAGNSFPTVLLDDTANDGSAEVQLPNSSTSQGRIKVACSNNIFFNVSPGQFSVSASSHYLALSGSPGVTEGNAGTTQLDFSVTLNGVSASSVTVDYTVNGSGASPANAADFGGTLPAGTLTFAPGQTVKTLSIPVSGDLMTESNETFSVTLGNAQNAAIQTGTANGTIINDDNTSTLSLAATNASQKEGKSGSTPFTFTVSRTGDTSGTSSAEWAVNGSGSNPASADDFADLAYPAGTVSFANGETSKTISINVAADKLKESDETFTVTLSTPSGAIIDNSTAEGTILDDDSGKKSSGSSGGGNSSALLITLLLLVAGYRRKHRSNP